MEIVVVADTGEDERSAFGCLGGRRSDSSAELPDPSFSLCAGAIEHRNVVMPACLEMPGHGEAHSPEPDPSNFPHGFSHPGSHGRACPAHPRVSLCQNVDARHKAGHDTFRVM